MTTCRKIQTEMWDFAVIPGKQIKTYPTEKNRLSYHHRIYADMKNFERDFGDYKDFAEIKKMWEGEEA